MDDKFYAALGRFITQFAVAESMTLSVLWKISGLELDVAKAIFNSSRVEQATAQIRKIHDGLQKTINADLDRALQQLAAINTFRNFIAHHGIGLTNTPDVFKTSKQEMIQSFDDLPSPIHFTVADLEAATHDLKTIWTCYAFLTMPMELRSNPLLSHLEDDARAPWKYTFPQPAPSSADRPAKTRKKPRQPRASPG